MINLPLTKYKCLGESNSYVVVRNRNTVPVVVRNTEWKKFLSNGFSVLEARPYLAWLGSWDNKGCPY